MLFLVVSTASAAPVPWVGPLSIDATHVDAQVVELADLDGDQTLDVIVGSSGGEDAVLWYPNTSGSFGGPNSLATNVTSVSFLAVGDFDEQGSLDVAAGSISEQTAYVYINPSWTPVQLWSSVDIRGLDVGDFNGDTHLDVVGTDTINGLIIFAHNDGSAIFTPNVAGGGAEALTFLIADDIGGSSLPDLFAAKSGNAFQYTNPGWGAPLPRGSHHVTHAARIDYEGDSDVDYLAGSTSGFPQGLYIYEGSLGSLGGSIIDQSYDSLDLAAADFDNDGDGDGVAVRFNGAMDWIENTDSTPTGFDFHPIDNNLAPISVAAGDLDGDGDADIVVGTANNGLVWFRNDTLGHPFGSEEGAAQGVDIGNAAIWGGAIMADVNDDDCPDIVVNTTSEGTKLLIQSCPGGGFTDQTLTLSTALGDVAGDRAIVAADLDNDGDTDLVRAAGIEVIVYLQDAAGRFGAAAGTAESQTLVDNAADFTGLGVADYTGDGYLDILADRGDGSMVTYVNDGDGSFSVIGGFVPFGTDSDYHTTGDVNGDGYPDSIGHRLSGDDLYLGQEGGFEGFGYETNIPTGGSPAGSALCDVDGDGEIDMVFAGQFAKWVEGPPTIPTALSVGVDSSGISCGDIDNDGDVDVFMGNRAFADELLINDGSGNFDVFTGFYNGPTRASILDDVDLDGDIDLYLQIDGDGNQLHINETDTANYLYVEPRTPTSACGAALQTRLDIGATVSVQFVGARAIDGGSGLGSMGPRRAHFAGPMIQPTNTIEVEVQFTSPRVLSTRMVRPADYPGHLYVVDSYDLDGDGVPTAYELLIHEAEGGSGDPDSDGLLAWDDPDSDNDGLTDLQELNGVDLCSTTLVDSDGDSVPDVLETDSDNDGIDDFTEVNVHLTDPRLADSDSDGVYDNDELIAGTDPLDDDTDNDGLGDGALDPHPLDADWDDDGWLDGSDPDPDMVDFDMDGLPDGLEAGHPPIPDGLSDGPVPVLYAGSGGYVGDADPVSTTDPYDDDSDDDGLLDGEEDVDHNGRFDGNQPGVDNDETDPNDDDTDDDGATDGDEGLGVDTDMDGIIDPLDPVDGPTLLGTDVTDALGIGFVDTGWGGTAWAHLNDDAYLDLIVTGWSRTAILLNNGGVDFTSTQVITATTAERSIVTADLDQDGDVDLIRNTDSRIQVWTNDGAGAFTFAWSFEEQQWIDSTLRLQGVAVLDVNDDQLLDIVAEAGEDGFAVFRNNGALDFDLDQSTGLPTANGSAEDGDWMAVADYDFDGRVDILVRKQGLANLWYQAAPAQFQPDTSFDQDAEADGGNFGSVAWCDIDNDSSLDVVTVGDLLSGSDSWLANGTWNATAFPPLGTGPGAIGCADLDHDGDLDVLVGVQGGDDIVLRNDGGSFVTTDVGVGIGDVGGVAFGDFDNDGDLDTAINAQAGNGLEIWRNDVDDGRSLLVRPRHDIGTCGSPMLVDDIGATVTVFDGLGAGPGIRHVSGGSGRGSQDQAVAHFGGIDAETTWFVEVNFMADTTVGLRKVVPTDLGPGRMLEIWDSDPDGDGIPSSIEDNVADVDPDGDGLNNSSDLDSDGDGTPDADEVVDPCNPADADADGTPDYQQNGDMTGHTGDTDADTDADTDSDTDVDTDTDADTDSDSDSDSDTDSDTDCELLDLYMDADNDGYGDPEAPLRVCVAGAGMVDNADDCNDADPAVHPSAGDPIDDGIDGNCDGFETTSFLQGNGQCGCAATDAGGWWLWLTAAAALGARRTF